MQPYQGEPCWPIGCGEKRSSENDGRSDVTDSLYCPDKLRLP